VDPDWLDSVSSILAQSRSEQKKGTLKIELFINLVISNLKYKNVREKKTVLTMQELEPHWATSSGGAGAETLTYLSLQSKFWKIKKVEFQNPQIKAPPHLWTKYDIKVVMEINGLISQGHIWFF
jgi:hypothetical protein